MRRIILSTAASVVAGAVALATPATTHGQADKETAKSQQQQQRQQQQEQKQKQQKSPATQPATFILVVPVPVVPVQPLPPGAVTGLAPRLAPDAEEIRDTLASVTEAAIATDGFNDVVERLVDADRNRIGSANVNDSALNDAAAKLREAWKAKFNREFDIDNESIVYASFPVIQGMIASEAQPAAARFAPNDAGDYNLEAGREVAIVGVPPTNPKDDVPELLIPVLDELGGWKIDIPNTVSAQQLRSSLAKQLNQVAQELPGTQMDEPSAFRHVTHHVLLGLMGGEAQEQQKQQQKRNQQKQQ